MAPNPARRYLAACCLALCICVTACTSGPRAGRTDHEALSFNTPVSWPNPDVTTFSLENGIRCFLIPDRELPLIQVRVSVRAGEFMVPREKAGLARIFGDAMRNGGSDTCPGEKLNTLLAEKAAQMEIGFGFISGTAGMDLLSGDLNTLLPVFADLLMHPAFPEKSLIRARQRLKTRIARRNDDQGSMAMRAYKDLIYGKNSLYAREPENDTVDRITREDLIRFHERAFQGANLLVGITGDIDLETLRPLMEAAFLGFPAGTRTRLDLPALEKKDRDASLFVVGKADVNQTHLLMGHLGDRRQNPDFAALQVMNQLLSGGFSGRLFETIRTEMGLAYSVSGHFGSHYFYPGLFYVELQTRTPATAEAVSAVRQVLQQMQQGVTPEELDQAKAQFFNSLVFRYDQAEEILGRRMQYAFRGMAPDSFQTLIQEIREVDAGDVARVARRYVKPDRLTVVAVGKEKAVEDQLEKLGRVTVLPRP